MALQVNNIDDAKKLLEQYEASGSASTRTVDRLRADLKFATDPTTSADDIGRFQDNSIRWAKQLAGQWNEAYQADSSRLGQESTNIANQTDYSGLSPEQAAKEGAIFGGSGRQTAFDQKVSDFNKTYGAFGLGAYGGISTQKDANGYIQQLDPSGNPVSARVGGNPNQSAPANMGNAGEAVKIVRGPDGLWQVVGAQTGKVLQGGLADQNAANIAATTLQSGSAPTVSGRPDLLAGAPGANQTVQSFVDPSTGLKINPTVATPTQMGQLQAGTLPSFLNANAGTYLDGKVFSELQGKLTEADLVRIGGKIYLKEGLTVDQIKARKANSGDIPPAQTGGVSPTSGVGVDVPSTVDSAMFSEAMGTPKTAGDINDLINEQAALQASYEAGLNKITDQPIPMEFISGQAASLERRYLAQQNVLTAKQEALTRQLTAAQSQFEMYASAGTDISQIPPEFFASMDQMSGAPAGLHKSVYESQIAASVAAQKTAAMEAASKLVDMLGKIPAGQQIEVNGSTYTGFGTTGIQSGMEVDANGVGTIWSFNELTGEHSTINIGQVGAGSGWETKTSSDGVRYLENKNTGERKLAQNGADPNGGTPAGIVSSFPDGSITPFERWDHDGKSSKWWAAQCAAVVNDWTGLGLGDTYASKQAKMDANITAENSQSGDVVIIPYGDNGHAAVINSKYEIDGELYYRLSESNWTKDANGIGVITHSRSIKASTVGGYARPGFKDPSYGFSTDAGGDLYSLDEAGDGNVSTFGREKDQKYLSDLDKLYGNLSTNPTVEDFTVKRNGYNTASSIPDTGSNAQQQISLVYSYMKLLDPQSVVREGEFATAQKYDGVLRQLGVKFDNLSKGKLVSDEVISNMKGEVERMFRASEDDYANVISDYTNQASQFRIDPEDLFVGLPSVGSSGGAAALKQKYPQYSSFIDSEVAAGSDLSEIEEILSGD